MVERLEKEGIQVFADLFSLGPTRVQLKRKDPRGWQEFREQLVEHSALGSAFIFRGVQLQRPPIFELETRLKQLQVPTLLMIGDEDEACIEPTIFMKRHILRAGLMVFPYSGHAINLEEPDLFNRAVLDFLTAVEAGK
jgi:pimeloyl-ACP methyl ester carboxylesterase